jgi:hypothetical protein
MTSFLKCVPTEIVSVLKRLEEWMIRRMSVAGHKICVAKREMQTKHWLKPPIVRFFAGDLCIDIRILLYDAIGFFN